MRVGEGEHEGVVCFLLWGVVLYLFRDFRALLVHIFLFLFLFLIIVNRVTFRAEARHM